jgi:hypothetical protein
VSNGVPMPEASVLFGVIKQMRAVKPIIIGVRTNKECPDGFVRLIIVGHPYNREEGAPRIFVPGIPAYLRVGRATILHR